MVSHQNRTYKPATRLYRVTLTQTGETKDIEAGSPEGAIKIANYPPDLCKVEEFAPPGYGTALELPIRTDRGTNALLQPGQIGAICEWAEEVGLRADLGHVCLMYGVPYPTVDGLAYHAKTVDPGMHYEVEHLTKDRKEDLGIDLGTFAAIVRVYNGNGVKIAERIGTVTGAEINEKSDRNTAEWRYPIVHKKPLEMVENRALWDALGDAYPLGISEPAPAAPLSMTKMQAIIGLESIGYTRDESLRLLDCTDPDESEQIKSEARQRMRAEGGG